MHLCFVIMDLTIRAKRRGNLEGGEVWHDGASWPDTVFILIINIKSHKLQWPPKEMENIFFIIFYKKHFYIRSNYVLKMFIQLRSGLSI